MLDFQELKDAKAVANSLELLIGDFEKTILLPQIISRLRYTQRICTQLLSIAEKKGVDSEFDKLLLSVLPEGATESHVRGVGLSYLSKVGAQLKEMVAEVDALVSRYPLETVVASKNEAIAFLNAANAVFRPFIDLRESLFKYDFRNTIVVHDRTTGEVIKAEPKHITVILSSFDIALGELQTVARSSSDSIQDWAAQMRQQQARNADFVVNFSNMKTAQHQLRANKFILWFQVAVIIFAAMAILLGNWADLAINNHRLEREVARLEAKVEDAEKARSQNNSELPSLPTKTPGKK